MKRFILFALFACLAFAGSLQFFPEAAFATDTDGDGIDDAMEAVLGTNPNASDSDGDTVDDYTEVFLNGTDPNLPDTDGDGLVDDSSDPDPLDDGTNAGGQTTPTSSYSCSTAPGVSETPMEGRRVNAANGQYEPPVYVVNFGRGYRTDNLLVLQYGSNVTLNDRWGWGIVSNWDGTATVNGSSVTIRIMLHEWTFTQSGGSYVRPASCPGTLTFDPLEDEFIFQFIRGGNLVVFDSNTGLQKREEDRFGNTTTITRNASGAITGVQFPEGNSVTVTTYSTGRYYQISDWSSPGRTWELKYNYYDELAKVTDPRGYTRQYFYLNGSQTSSLNGNLTRMVLPAHYEIRTEYDGQDRVSKQTLAGAEATFSYTSTATTVNDFAGNQRVWNHSAGSVVPSSLVEYSNRNVRTSDPATWTTTFAHNSELLRIKTVLPEGNRIDQDWDSSRCMTERRFKATDTDTDSGSDLVWSFRYTSTYHVLDQATDPEGNTTDRSFDALDFVTGVTYETITHTDPDVTISESFSRNSNGQVTDHTDGEGVVTHFDYYSTGATKGLLWKKTTDYGTGKLNLVDTFAYSDTRYVTSYTDPDSITTTYTVDALGNPESETGPSPQNYEVTYEWDGEGNLISKLVENVDKTNTRDTSNPWFETSYSYDGASRVDAVTEEIDSTTTRTTQIDHDGNGNVTIVTLPEGNKIRNVWDERGLLAERTKGYTSVDAATEKWVYDGNRNLMTYTNGRGKSFSKAYDDYDRVTKETLPAGEYTSYVLDKNGNVKEIKGYDDQDVLLSHTKQHFDELNRIWKTERWLDNPAPTADEWLTTTYVLDKRGLLTQVTDPLSHSTYTTFDNARRKTAWEDHLGNEIDWSYANDYRVATQIDEVENVPGGGTETFTTEIVTDNLHRVTTKRVVDRDSSTNKHVFTTKYDSLSVAVEQEDAEGNKTYYAHDGLGRVTKKEVDLGSGNKIETWFTFDDNGNQTGLKDDNLNETTWDFNARDLPKKITYANNDYRTFTYNDDDTLAGWTDENGTQVANGYNDNGWLTARTITRATNVLGPTSESYSYDGLGRMITATNSNSVVQTAYDTLSRMTSQTQGPNPLGQNGKTISYTYNDDGSRATATYPSSYALTYTVDAVGRWTKIEDSSSNDLVIMSFYGPGMRAKQASYLNGTSENLGWNGFRWVTDVDHKDSQATVFAGFDYAYDKMGNPLYEERTHDSGKGDLYAYDKAYRLTSALLGSTDPSAENADGDWLDYAYDKQVDYSMDDVSNRSSVTETPYGQQGTSTSYSSNSVNWYTAVGGVTRSHDANGNLTADGTYDYYYDYRNNLVKVEQNSTVVAAYEFDALGRRTKKTVGQTVTKFFYDGEECVEEYDGSDDLLRKFVYGQRIDEIRLMIAPDVADVDGDQNTTEVLNFYFHHNMLGSVTHVTGPNETVVEKYDYTPYGKTTIEDGQGNDLSGQSAIGNPYMFSARRLDEETGLYHYRRRAYDPECGRFLQRDPLGYVDGPSLYEYVMSRPVRLSDPLGTKVSWEDALEDEANGGANPILRQWCEENGETFDESSEEDPAGTGDVIAVGDPADGTMSEEEKARLRAESDLPSLEEQARIREHLRNINRDNWKPLVVLIGGTALPAVIVYGPGLAYSAYLTGLPHAATAYNVGQAVGGGYGVPTAFVGGAAAAWEAVTWGLRFLKKAID